MDVAALSMNLAQINTMNSFGVAMLDKNLDMMKDAGAAMVQMMDSSMELSVNPNVGGNFDMRV
ncbi:MAG: YjfB family protein [Lachnospiraceae bacterium]|nr:YjfB family protein [Lachnospiraceae bacterium]